MWGRNPKPAGDAGETLSQRLRAAVRDARIESAERTGIIVELRDAEAARLAALNEALDPLFAAVPADLDMFDRGISPGETPRLWIDIVGHVVMGRDKRTYRFLQDTRNGRIVLAEAAEIADMVEAVTKYVARRLVERERALASDELRPRGALAYDTGFRWRRRWQVLRVFLVGLAAGFAALFAVLFVLATRS
jgi:hypothetical protein